MKCMVIQAPWLFAASIPGGVAQAPTVLREETHRVEALHMRLCPSRKAGDRHPEVVLRAAPRLEQRMQQHRQFRRR